MTTSIHVLSLNDLQHTIQRYGRIRAFCPVHGSDRQRSLSIAAYGEMQGWGHCHSCKVTVLIAELNPDSARRLGYRGEMQEVDVPTEPQAEKWQRDELAALRSLYPRMQQALDQKKPQTYLAERGIPFDLAKSFGLAYLPRLTEQLLARYPLLNRWQDRLIFPYVSYAADTGYLGRSLALWKPGMDENEHKQMLDEQGIRRYIKTYRSGLLCQTELAAYEHITLVEGPFDWLALLADGFTDIVALASTDIQITAIPLSVHTVTLAFDSDQAGIAAAQKLATELRRSGIPTQICTPPDDNQGKDWSERYRLQGSEGLAPLRTCATQDEASTVEAEPPIEPVEQEVFECSVCGVDLNREDQDGSIDENCVPYCATHWEALQQSRSGATRSQEQFIETTNDIATSTFGSEGYTLAQEEEQEQPQAAARPVVTVHARGESLPTWLDPAQKDWARQVERNGLAEMLERRAAWYRQHNRAIPALPTQWRILEIQEQQRDKMKAN